VIHTPGPVWRGGRNREDELLANCYRHSLELASQHEARTVAFPAISTGVYDFPLARATRIAFREALRFLAQHTLPEKVVFVCFGEETYDCYKRIEKEMDVQNSK
jgi:O-acetyl-ADP-ribose deacetylase